MMKKIISLFMTLVMILSVTNVAVYAIEPTGTLCEHHAEHNETCGYVAADAGAPCMHIHDETCGYEEAVSEMPCDGGCMDTDGDGVIDHVEGCSYQPAVEGHACTHIHDAVCGYQEATEGKPCGYVCEICDDTVEDEDSEIVCSCETQCTEDKLNEDCSVCSVNWESCAGEAETEVSTPKPMLLVQSRNSVDSYDSLNTAINEATNNVETKITLSNDIEVTKTIEIPSSKIITLDLGGHTVSYTDVGHISIFTVKGNLTLIGSGIIRGGTGNNVPDPYVYKGGGVYVDTNATFNMGTKEDQCNVEITENRAPTSNRAFGGGVYISSDATFNMYSGTISKNFVNYKGAGVYVSSDATFDMHGGTISENEIENTNDSEHGAGVYVSRGATFNMYDGTISGNKAGTGGGVYVDNATFNMENGTISENLCRDNVGAAAVYVKGKTANFVMNGGLIDKNIARYDDGNNNGCAVKVDSGGKFELNENGTISNTQGNGVIVTDYYDYSSRKYSAFTMNGGTITGNKATTSPDVIANGTLPATHAGGAGVLVQNSCTFTMNDGTITGNEAFSYGGGVYVVDATFKMNDGTITENTAKNNGGGGVCLSRGKMTMKGGNITENHAQYGGGIYLSNSSNFDRTAGDLYFNTAEQYGDDVALKSIYPNDLKLGAVDSDWTVYSCGDTVDGWYQDGKWKINNSSEGDVARWNASISVDDNVTKQCVADQAVFAKSIGNFTPNYYYGVYGIKAAHGSKTYYTVTFNYNDGTTPDIVENVIRGNAVSAPAEPEREGYTFVGWYKDGEDTQYDFNWLVWNKTVLVAKWEKKLTLNYDLTEGVGADGIDYSEKEYAKDEEILVLPAPSKEDYTFIEWNTEQNGEGTSYQPGDHITLAQDTTLYAQWTPNIKIQPANITIYMGGSSYGGVVDTNGNLVGNNGFPEPGFTVILPEELNSVDMSKLYLQYKENDNSLLKWKFEKYGDGEHNIYRIVVDGETPQRDVRMEFENEQGQIVKKDTFDIKEHLNQTLIMRVYGDGIDAGKVSFMYEDKIYGISVLPATLTVRGTTNAVQYADPSDGIIAEKPGLITQEGTSYYVNGSEVEVVNTTGICLLFDEIINSNEANDNRTNLLLQRVEKILGNSDSDRVYDFKYLDLVDQNNGNAWVKADKPVTIYWPLPEGTNADTSFTLLHFTEAHRSLTEEQIKDAINNGDVETMKIKEVTNTHVVFDVTPGNFSPFVLIGEEKKSSDSGASSGGGHTSNTYYVRYHDNVETVKDGKFIPGETVTVKGNIFTAPRGKVLAGWSLEEDGKVEYKAGDTFRMPGKTLDLYAVWKDAEIGGHKAYITGYPDGTVGPDRSITRAEAATMFYNLLTDKSADKRLFADVPMDQWYAKPVTTLAGLGIISGYPDGTFKPNSPITRAEFVTMAMNFANAEKGTACSFPDVSENIWYYGAVAGATEHGWISGYPDGTFGPERNITRGEVASIINRMENRAADISFILENLDELHTFSDLPFQHWAYGSMMEAANGHNYVRESANAYEVWVSAQ